MATDPEQLRNLLELETMLREAVEKAESSRVASRYQDALSELQNRIDRLDEPADPLPRKEERMSGIIPVKIASTSESGEQVTLLAHTVNVSFGGARLAGLTGRLRKGSIVKVVRGRTAADFRVVWVGPNNQAGVEATNRMANLWGLDRFRSQSSSSASAH